VTAAVVAALMAAIATVMTVSEAGGLQAGWGSSLAQLQVVSHAWGQNGFLGPQRVPVISTAMLRCARCPFVGGGAAAPGMNDEALRRAASRGARLHTVVM
jgi:hypothetical protein